MMWAKYEVSLQGKPVKILGDEGFFSADIPPGKLEIRSRHVSEKLVVGLDLTLETNHTYFVKLDPDAEKFSVLGALTDVLAISAVVAGAKAQMQIESGQGSLGDAATIIQGEQAKDDLAPNHPLGYHLLLEVEESTAAKEIAACCSSKNAEDVGGVL
jgi:hypothetical protein